DQVPGFREPGMVTDKQVRLLRKKRMAGKTLEAAASAVGMSERTARKWQRGAVPSATKTPRTWRTRPDPFTEVWATEIEPVLVQDKEGELEAKAIWEDLCRRRPGVFEAGQLRTLQVGALSVRAAPARRRDPQQARRWPAQPRARRLRSVPKARRGSAG